MQLGEAGRRASGAFAEQRAFAPPAWRVLILSSRRLAGVSAFNDSPDVP